MKHRDEKLYRLDIATFGLSDHYGELSRLTVVSREAKKKQHARTSSGLRDHYTGVEEQVRQTRQLPDQ